MGGSGENWLLHVQFFVLAWWTPSTLPTPVEYRWCACDLEEGRGKVRLSVGRKAACQAVKPSTCFPCWHHLGIWSTSSPGIGDPVNIAGAPEYSIASERDQEQPLLSLLDLLPRESQFHPWQSPEILGCKQKEARQSYMFCAFTFYFLVVTSKCSYYFGVEKRDNTAP